MRPVVCVFVCVFVCVCLIVCGCGCGCQFVLSVGRYVCLFGWLVACAICVFRNGECVLIMCVVVCEVVCVV